LRYLVDDQVLCSTLGRSSLLSPFVLAFSPPFSPVWMKRAYSFPFVKVCGCRSGIFSRSSSSGRYFVQAAFFHFCSYFSFPLADGCFSMSWFPLFVDCVTSLTARPPLFLPFPLFKYAGDLCLCPYALFRLFVCLVGFRYWLSARSCFIIFVFLVSMTEGSF